VPNSKITNLTALTADDADEVPINRSGTDGKVTVAGIRSDFLHLSDTPNSYSGFEAQDSSGLPRLGLGANVVVNDAGDGVNFRWSTADYIDIRDYGFDPNVSDDIGPPLQAVFDDLTGLGGSFTAAQHIRVPKIGAGVYTCSAITFPINAAIVLELDCQQITIATSWALDTGQSVVGRQYASSTNVHPYLPLPRPSILFSDATDAAIEIGQHLHNILIENLSISNGGGGPAVHAEIADLITIKNCMLTGAPALYFDTCFWMQIENVYLAAAATEYAAIFATDVPASVNAMGILRGRHWIVASSLGVLFRGGAGTQPANNCYIEDIHSESQPSGASLINFDSSSQGAGQIEIIRPEQSDALGTVYLLKNVGTATKNVIIRAANREDLIDPTSDPIDGLLFDSTYGFQNNEDMNESLTSLYAGSNEAVVNWRQETIGVIDAKLATSPVGLPLTIGTPLAIIQNPASWTNLGGTTITTGILAPDGSTMAGRVAGGGGVQCYSASHNFAVGDFIIQGVWVRNPSGGAIAGSTTGLNALGAPGFSGLSSIIGLTLYDNITENGWQWRCVANKITASAGSTPYRFDLSSNGATREFFNPCAMLIPASAGVDQVSIYNIARALKGGWSSTATQGDVALLDHQPLKAVGGITCSALVATGDVTSGDDVIVGDDILMPTLGSINWNSGEFVIANEGVLGARKYLTFNTNSGAGGPGLIVGSTTSLGSGAFEGHATAAGAAITIGRWSNDTSPARCILTKSRNATVATAASGAEWVIVQDNDSLGEIIFGGADGAEGQPGAIIVSRVDGSPALGAVPGEIVFQTYVTGSPVDRLAIRNDGGVIIGDGTTSPGAESLSVEGKIATPMRGELTIASGAITVTGSYHRVDTEGDGATDDLTTINGGIDGMRLVLRAENGARDVVVKDGTGNIQCVGDFTMDNVQDTIELIYDSTLTAWLEIGRSDSGA
jgi:hypothetical protein